MTETGSDVATLSDAPSFALEREPVYDLLNERQRALLHKLSPNVSREELAQGLELAFAYKLDPYAKEVWFTKSRPKNGREGKLLIMVARDGLRKIANRQGIRVDCDVVRKEDEFEVVRDEQRNRVVTHRYKGGSQQRGPIIGAWAEAYRPWRHKDFHGVETTGAGTLGFFFAPLEEYDPKDTSGFSPWSKQKSVMILAAAERQAIRQATPLGGMLAEGEDDVIDATVEEVALEAPSDPLAWVDALGVPDWLREEVKLAIEQADYYGHAGLSDPLTAQMVLHGADEARVEEWVKAARAEIDAMQPAAEEPPAGSTPDEPNPTGTPDSGAQDEASPTEHMRDHAQALRDRADFVDEPLATQLRGEADALEAEAAAAADADQQRLV